MAVIPVQECRQPGTPGTRLDAKGVEDFLAGEHRVLRLLSRIRALRMGLG
jgi:hypothetical protein